MLTLQIEIDDIRCHLVLLRDSAHVEYYELGLEFLAPDLVRYQHEPAHLTMVVYLRSTPYKNGFELDFFPKIKTQSIRMLTWFRRCLPNEHALVMLPYDFFLVESDFLQMLNEVDADIDDAVQKMMSSLDWNCCWNCANYKNNLAFMKSFANNYIKRACVLPHFISHNSLLAYHTVHDIFASVNQKYLWNIYMFLFKSNKNHLNTKSIFEEILVF